MVSDMECIFCKIIRNEVQSYKIYEDEKVLVVLDILPASRGQMIVIPKEHKENFHELDEETISKMFSITRLLSRILLEELGAKGVHIVVNNGEIAGQTQPHIVVNIIPRYGNEKVFVAWQKEQVSPEFLESVQKEITRHLFVERKEERKEEKNEEEELLRIVYLSDVVKKRSK